MDDARTTAGAGMGSDTGSTPGGGEAGALPDQMAEPARGGKAGRKAAKQARKAADRAEKAAVKAVRKAAKAAAKAARSEAKKAAKADRKAAKAAKEAKAPKTRPMAASSEDTGTDGAIHSEPPGPDATVRASGGVTAPAGVPVAAAMLQEVADLVRQATRPPASRIIERVGRPADPDDRAPEPAAAGPRGVDEQATATQAEPMILPEPPTPAEPVTPAEPQPPTQAEPATEAEPEPVTPATGAGRRSELVGQTVEPPSDGIVAAAIDIGANSAHLLVAAAGGHRVEPRLDESVFLGLGERVATDGLIGATARAEVVAALVGYADVARRLGARDIVIVGTEPLRRAADAASLVHEVEAAAGVPVHVLDHDEEAMLTLLGVTMGRSIGTDLLVVDVGGGSSELVLAGPRGVVQSIGIRLGSAKLTLDHFQSDPPTLAEIEAMRAVARATLAEAPDIPPADMVAVGGTASNLLRLMPSSSLDRVLTRRRIAVTLAMLSVQRSHEAAERHLIRPERARILPAGAVIVDSILERYGIARLRVVEEGIREGAVLAAAAAGPCWRDRLPTLVKGWPDRGFRTR